MPKKSQIDLAIEGLQADIDALTAQSKAKQDVLDALRRAVAMNFTASRKRKAEKATA